MTNINFDEPSIGTVSSTFQTALAVTNTGAEGVGVSGTGSVGVVGTSAATGGLLEAGVVGVGNGACSGVFARANGTGPALFAMAEGGDAGVNIAASLGTSGCGAFIAGDVAITGDITTVNTVTVAVDLILSGGDCAEHFEVAGVQHLEPGSVVVIDREGAIRESQDAYDKKVAGVISGGGEYRPAIVLDQRPTDGYRPLVALVGKVYCKVDASVTPIDVGDLLTASSTPGHAMRASDPAKAFGAVIGKALRPLQGGKGLIPILVALQ